MPHVFKSEKEFFSRCSCAYNLKSYAETLCPPNAIIDFVFAYPEENTYIAQYDVLTRSGIRSKCLKVSCTELPDHTYQYKVIQNN